MPAIKQLIIKAGQLEITLSTGEKIFLPLGEIKALLPGEFLKLPSMTIWRRPYSSSRFHRSNSQRTLLCTIETQEGEIKLELPRSIVSGIKKYRMPRSNTTEGMA